MNNVEHNQDVTKDAEGQSLLNEGLGLRPRIEAHIRQLSPHMMQREGVVLLRESLTEIELLRTALQLSTNGLRHCSRWNISEKTEKAIMTQVIANETLLMPNAEIRG